MWGCISTEASYQLNFNTSFTTFRSDVLIHLAQWQYWWWFWFAFLWSFYYLVMVRVVRFRTLKMRPKIVTSYRPHGKWGDFLAAIIPGLWCLNILTNSNFILRLIEWQNESSIFLVRIRAKQWYWIYKFEMKNLIDILATPKNIGRNKWFFTNFGDLQYSENYFNTLRLKSKIVKTEEFWSLLFRDMDQNNNEITTLFTENFNDLKNDLNFNYLDFSKINTNLNFENFYFNEYCANLKIWQNDNNNINNLINLSSLFKKHNYINESTELLNNLTSNFNNYYFFKKNNYINYSNFELQSRFFKKNFGTNVPFRIKKTPFNVISADISTVEKNNILFNLSFNNSSSTLHAKQVNDIFLFTIKQLRYKRRLSLPTITKINKNNELIFKGKTILLNNNTFSEFFKNPEHMYKLSQKNKIFNEHMTVNLTHRLLRTRRTLVLPAHMNVTLITNSFDVVHSWFVPGLGLKLDCVPGRSTHHTLYIDNVGFYYGQCAEICGRYHHHMPIRICALPFEHFLIWWNIFGLPRIMFLKKKNVFTSTFACRKFLW